MRSRNRPDYFGARYYDAALGIWLGVDPLAEKYPAISPFTYVVNNPIRLVDPNGMEVDDIIFYDTNGNEVSRIKSNTEFKSFVQTGSVGGDPTYTEAPMPSQTVIDNKGTMLPYTDLDHQIAASTFIVNNKIANNEVNGTPKHQFTQNSQPPVFLPNLVKAMAIEESDMGQPGPNGTGAKDPIMANYPGDWNSSSDVKTAAGMFYRQDMNPNASIQGGLQVLLLKGMWSDTNGNYTTWRGTEKALNKYGPGPSTYGASIISNQKALQNGTRVSF
ncbi:MAG: hypothetical protein IPP37_02480 [Saprospiraceae bacterium]|nr:hypothetical protein [Saprospiraceae bacterium]